MSFSLCFPDFGFLTVFSGALQRYKKSQPSQNKMIGIYFLFTECPYQAKSSQGYIPDKMFNK